MLRRLLNIALNPFFQALAVALIIIIFVPLGVNKFISEQVAMSTSFDQTRFEFADLDKDGHSERIQTFINFAGNAGLSIRSENTVIGQWNFRGIFQPGCDRIMTGDYNHNGLEEIYVFTLVNDSIILHAMEYGSPPSFFKNDRFISLIGASLKDPDHRILPVLVTDMNNDGFGDLIFAINAGFSKQPRNLFLYDIKNDYLICSPQSGVQLSKFHVCDLNNDGYKEILMDTYASDNFNDVPIPYSDNSAWLMVLNNNLDFLFTPLEFPGPTSSVELIPINTGSNETLILGKFIHASPLKGQGKLFLANHQGKIIKELNIQFDDYLFEMQLLSTNYQKAKNIISGLILDVGFYKINEKLEVIQVGDIKTTRWLPDLLDIDLDGSDEIIALAPDLKKHLIIRNDFSHPVALDFPVQSTNPVFSIKLNGPNPPQLSVQGDQVWKLFDYCINPVYRFRFLIWLGIYLAVLSFILIIRKLYSFQIKKRYETEKKITTLQLSSVKAQMEPHFIMNTINTIGSSIYRQKPDEAYQLLVNFSGMVRSLLLSSDKMTLSLKEELDFVVNYLELEKSRFPDLFNYTIRQEEGIHTEYVIPKMIIHLHAENALKHGLMPKKTGGLLDIAVHSKEDYIVIIISDNGIGRNLASRNFSQSTGKGMKILYQFFETYNKHNKLQLRQEVVDLFDDEKNPAGTEVRIFVPVNFNKEIF